MTDTQAARAGPWLVLDWNLLQSMPRERDVPARYQCVVLDQAFHEIANKEPGRDLAAIRKFGGWAARNAARLWVAHTPEDLFERQLRTGGGRLKLAEVIHPQFTRELRRVARLGGYDWTVPLLDAHGSDPVRHRREQIATLVRLCSDIAELWKRNPATRLPRADERPAWLRQPNLVTDLIERYFRPRWRAEWRPLVAADPNRFALVRWARFIAWSCLRRADGQTVKYENNFDDAHYGLLASYTGHLGTDDRALAAAAAAIFPGIRLVPLHALADAAPKAS